MSCDVRYGNPIKSGIVSFPGYFSRGLGTILGGLRVAKPVRNGVWLLENNPDLNSRIQNTNTHNILSWTIILNFFHLHEISRVTGFLLKAPVLEPTR